MWSETRCERIWSKRPMRGGGRASGIASAATGRDSWTTVRWRCRDVGDSTCNRRRPQRSWRRCGVPWCVAVRLAKRLGSSGRRSDWVCNRRSVPAAVRGNHRPAVNKDSRPLYSFLGLTVMSPFQTSASPFRECHPADPIRFDSHFNSASQPISACPLYFESSSQCCQRKLPPLQEWQTKKVRERR